MLKKSASRVLNIREAYLVQGFHVARF